MDRLWNDVCVFDRNGVHYVGGDPGIGADPALFSAVVKTMVLLEMFGRL